MDVTRINDFEEGSIFITKNDYYGIVGTEVLGGGHTRLVAIIPGKGWERVESLEYALEAGIEKVYLSGASAENLYTSVFNGLSEYNDKREGDVF